MLGVHNLLVHEAVDDGDAAVGTESLKRVRIFLFINFFMKFTSAISSSNFVKCSPLVLLQSSATPMIS